MKKMRFLSWRFYLISAFVTNFVIAVIMWSYLDSRCQNTDVHRNYNQRFTLREIHRKHKTESWGQNFTDESLSEKLIVIIRDFEFFENDIVQTVQSIVQIFPSLKVVILSDKLIYPPLTDLRTIPNSNVHLISLKPTPEKSASDLCLKNLIDKEHVLVVPDSVRFNSRDQVIEMLKVHIEKPSAIIAAPIEGVETKCMYLNVSLRHWTIKYKENPEKYNCEALQGDFVLLVTKSLLMRLNEPFARPFPHSLFIQSTIFNVKVTVMKNLTFQHGIKLFSEPHSKWKRDTLETGRKQAFYQDFGIKKALLPASRVEWYGCNKNSERCFGTVVNDMPEYLFEGRWTPPCCLENLRQTARYVFTILEKCNVRYWLEGGSLLGAVRTADIIPWDYDVDIGIYKDDILKCEWLKNAQQQSIIDNQGFVWEKATEGDFIRVQYSSSNHLHVDIFPFYSKNGIMTKDTWFANHRQDMEFPEHYLKPLKRVKFVGVHAFAPNNYREFLEMKFGKGAIESPKYPVPEVLTFSRKRQSQIFVP